MWDLLWKFTATEKDLHFLRKQFLVVVVLCYTVHSMSFHWMFFV